MSDFHARGFSSFCAVQALGVHEKVGGGRGLGPPRHRFVRAAYSEAILPFCRSYDLDPLMFLSLTESA